MSASSREKELEKQVEDLKKEALRYSQAEKALQESENRYRMILEEIQDAYYEVDYQGNFTFMNQQMCNLLGYSRDELLGKNNRDYMDKKNARLVYQTFNRVYQTGNPSSGFDWELIRKDEKNGGSTPLFP